MEKREQFCIYWKFWQMYNVIWNANGLNNYEGKWKKISEKLTKFSEIQIYYFLLIFLFRLYNSKRKCLILKSIIYNFQIFLILIILCFISFNVMLVEICVCIYFHMYACVCMPKMFLPKKKFKISIKKNLFVVFFHTFFHKHCVKRKFLVICNS